MKVFTSVLILAFWMSFVATEDFKNHNINRTKREPPIHPPASFQGYPKSPAYSPPKPLYGPPKPVYGPPKSIYGPPKSIYGTPKAIYTPPSSSYSPVSSSYNYDVPTPVYSAPRYNRPVYSPGVYQTKYSLPPSSPNYKFYPSYRKPSTVFTPPSPNYGVPSPVYEAPSLNYGAPSLSYPAPSPTYGQPSPKYEPPFSSYGAPASSSYEGPSPYKAPPLSSYGVPPPLSFGTPPSPAYGTPPSPAYGTPTTPSYGTSLSPSYAVPPSPFYEVPPSSTYEVPPPSSKYAPPPSIHSSPFVSYKAPASRYVSTYSGPSSTYEISINSNPLPSSNGISHGSPSESYGGSSGYNGAPVQDTYVSSPYTHATPASGNKYFYQEYAGSSYDAGGYTYERPLFNPIGSGYEIPVTYKPHPLQYNSQATSYETPGALTSYGTPAVNHEPPINYGTSEKRANFVLGDRINTYEDTDTIGLSSSVVTNASGHKQDSLASLPEIKTENRTLNHNFDGPGVTDHFLLETAFKSKQLNKRANAKGIINNF